MIFAFIRITSSIHFTAVPSTQYKELLEKNTKMLFAEYAKRKEALENEQAETK